MRRFQLLVGLGFLIIFFRLFHLQILEGNRYLQLSKANSIRILKIRGARGRIFDRQGKIIVDNRFSYELLVYPQNIENPDDFLKRLSSILGIPFIQLKNKFLNTGNFSALPISLVSDLSKEKAVILEELKFQFPQIAIQAVPKRNYPYDRLGSHILGYLSSIDWWRLTRWKDYGYSLEDTVGYGGVEERYDYYLKAQDGGLQLEVDNRGRLRRILGFRPPQNGKDIYLTIDLEVQKLVEEALEGYSGAVIIMDSHTGEIIAMASSPNFSLTEISFSPSILKSILSGPQAPLVNRAISGLYPPGSVFKPVLAVAGLENRRIDKKTTFFCEGSLKIGKDSFGCWDKHGYQNIFEAIVHSCNVFFYRLGISLGAEKLSEYALKFGLGKSTHIDLPEEKEGFIPHPLLRKIIKKQSWFEGDTANFSIGQGELLATPLQILRMISIFANKGKLVRPYIVKSIEGKDISSLQRNIITIPIKESVLKFVQEALEAVVRDPTGTAHVLYMHDLPIAGKTGTAQVAKKQPHGWFAGYFPTRSGYYSICVVLEHVGSGYHACLVAKKIIEKMKDNHLL